MRKTCQNTGFSDTYTPIYKDKIFDSILILEYTSQKKPIFWHILHSGNVNRKVIATYFYNYGQNIPEKK